MEETRFDIRKLPVSQMRTVRQRGTARDIAMPITLQNSLTGLLVLRVDNAGPNMMAVRVRGKDIYIRWGQPGVKARGGSNALRMQCPVCGLTGNLWLSVDEDCATPIRCKRCFGHDPHQATKLAPKLAKLVESLSIEYGVNKGVVSRALRMIGKV